MDFPLILMANQAIEESRVILPILEKVQINLFEKKIKKNLGEKC